MLIFWCNYYSVRNVIAAYMIIHWSFNVIMIKMCAELNYIRKIYDHYKVNEWIVAVCYRLIDWIGFYTVSAIFQPYNGSIRYQMYPSGPKVNYYYSPLNI